MLLSVPIECEFLLRFFAYVYILQWNLLYIAAYNDEIITVQIMKICLFCTSTFQTLISGAVVEQLDFLRVNEAE